MQINDEILRIKDTILKTTECEKIYLFGSYAYGTPSKDSDYDFFVVLKDDIESKYPILEQISLNMAKAKFDAQIDVVAEKKRFFEERSVLPSIEKKVKNDGVLLYAR
ncbi:MAG: nucleotidyltransferase domain-containing protein [Chitinivibrionia bacterium]|nr:nucleotidyltransferase domain-containing protein [Chitinivibrionia bacterium]